MYWLTSANASLCEEISGKTYSWGCQRPTRCGRMSKLAFLIVRRLSPGELLIFMQTRKQERCEAAFCKTISNLKPKRIRPTNIQRDPFLHRCLPGENLYFPQRLFQLQWRNIVLFIYYALSPFFWGWGGGSRL